MATATRLRVAETRGGDAWRTQKAERRPRVWLIVCESGGVVQSPAARDQFLNLVVKTNGKINIILKLMRKGAPRIDILRVVASSVLDKGATQLRQRLFKKLAWRPNWSVLLFC